jgi:transcriptional regulator with XRE-family HTH domain
VDMIPTMVRVDEAKLRRLRLGKGWTQVQLADRARVSPDTVVRWEGGRVDNPQPSALAKLAKALGVEPSDLLD